MKANFISKSLLGFLSVFSLVACADTQSVEEAADQYCEIYNPSSWKGISKSAEAYEIYNYIVTVQNETVTNSDFSLAVGNADSSSFTDFYYSARKNIEALLGSTWDCDHFDQFYLPLQTIISLSLGGVSKDRIDPNNPDTVVISISHQGDVLVGNAALASTSHDTITAAVKSRIASKELEAIRFVLYADSGADGSLVPKVLNSLTQIGVKNVSFIDY